MLTMAAPSKDLPSSPKHQHCSDSDSDDSDVDYSEEEGDAVDEGIPEVYIDSRGFHSLV